MLDWVESCWRVLRRVDAFQCVRHKRHSRQRAEGHVSRGPMFGNSVETATMTSASTSLTSTYRMRSALYRCPGLLKQARCRQGSLSVLVQFRRNRCLSHSADPAAARPAMHDLGPTRLARHRPPTLASHSTAHRMNLPLHQKPLDGSHTLKCRLTARSDSR